MKTRAIILAGGEGTRLGVLTAKRAKPAVPFGGKYRIIDFPLSNCVNSNIFDVIIIAQYRPQSMIEHIGAGGPWDLNRDFTGGVRIFTPYKARSSSWFIGTADAVQQNFSFIKRGDPDLMLILSGDHVYAMDYDPMIQYHLDHHADITLATIRVPPEEAHRFGIVAVNPDGRVSSFIEKPAQPPSNLVNMGIYLFNSEFLNRVLWEDHMRSDSSHDFGKDIIPSLINSSARVFAYPYTGYWVDVGMVNSYWQAHMDLLGTPPALNLHDRAWVIHTRTEERPPAMIEKGAVVEDSMVCDGCVIERDAVVTRCFLSPGVRVCSGANIQESIILTDSVIGKNAIILRSILDKRVQVGEGCQVGAMIADALKITTIGKNSILPPQTTLEAGVIIGTDVQPNDLPSPLIKSGQVIQTRRLPNEL